MNEIISCLLSNLYKNEININATILNNGYTYLLNGVKYYISVDNTKALNSEYVDLQTGILFFNMISILSGDIYDKSDSISQNIDGGFVFDTDPNKTLYINITRTHLMIHELVEMLKNAKEIKSEVISNHLIIDGKLVKLENAQLQSQWSSPQVINDIKLTRTLINADCDGVKDKISKKILDKIFSIVYNTDEPFSISLYYNDDMSISYE